MPPDLDLDTERRGINDDDDILSIASPAASAELSRSYRDDREILIPGIFHTAETVSWKDQNCDDCIFNNYIDSKG